MSIASNLAAELMVLKVARYHVVIAKLQGFVPGTHKHLDVEYAAFFGMGRRGRWEVVEGRGPNKTIKEFRQDLDDDLPNTKGWEMIHLDRLHFSQDAKPADLLRAPSLAGIGILASLVTDFPNQTATMVNHGVWASTFLAAARRAWDHPEEDLKLLMTGAERPEDRPWPTAMVGSPERPIYSDAKEATWEEVEAAAAAERERRDKQERADYAARRVTLRAEEDRLAEEQLQSLVNEQDMKGFGAWA